jgi:hypothetical protein
LSGIVRFEKNAVRMTPDVPLHAGCLLAVRPGRWRCFGVLAFVMTASDFRQKRLFFVLRYAYFVFRHARSELPLLCSKDVV